MIKVIEHGYARYTVRCYNCHCYFEYELEDIKNGDVKCPDCGYKCGHNYTLNVKITSQIKPRCTIDVIDSTDIKE